MMHSFVDWMGFWSIKALIFLLNLLPIRCALFLARLTGRIVYLFHKRRHVAYVNLKAALGETYESAQLKKIAAGTYENIAQIGVEMFRFPIFDRAYVEKNCSVEGYDELTKALEAKKGVIFLTAHFGNWEISSIISALLGHPMKVLVREQKHSRLNDILTSMRATHGNEVIGKGMALREIVKALHDNQIVGILSDQSGGPTGVYVDFFGRRTTTPAGAISIAQRTGCVVLPTFIIRKKRNQHVIQVNKPLVIPDTGDSAKDVETGITSYVKILEAYIRAYPDQWLWGHKRWKYTLDKSVLVLTDKKPGHENQSKALMSVFDGIAQKEGYGLKKTFCAVSYRSTLHRVLLHCIAPLLSPYIRGRLGLLKLFLRPESYACLSRVYADVVVQCGSSTAPVARLLQAENMAKIISIMKPPFPYECFDYTLVILPKHDTFKNSKQKTVRLSTALSVTDEAFLTETSATLRERFAIPEGKIFSVLIGGDTKNYAFDFNWTSKTIDAICALAESENAFLLVTTSRRTRPDIIDMIKTRLGDCDRCKLLVVPTEENIENVVYGMMGLADAVFVTEDSVSMISESIHAGKKVFVLQMARTGLPKKHAAFQKNLMAEKAIVRTTFGTLIKSFQDSPPPEQSSHENDYETLAAVLKESIK
jgi:Kdo2-lipid IVA lauroyltransferase/acyltransferase